MFLLKRLLIFRSQKAKTLTVNTTILHAKDFQTHYDVTITVSFSQVSLDKVGKYKSWLLFK